MNVNSSPTNETFSLKKVDIDWNNSIEDLLCEEAEKCSGLAWMHSNAEKIYRNKNNWIQIPMIILSTLSGSLQVGMSNLFDTRVAQSFGALSFIVSMLGMINSHFAYAQRAEAHKVASVQYGQMHRLIHIEMSLTRSQRTPPKYLLKMIKDDLKAFMEHFPRIPDKVIEEYKKKVIPNSKGAMHPDIVSGIKRVVPYEKDKINSNSPPTTSTTEEENASSFDTFHTPENEQSTPDATPSEIIV